MISERPLTSTAREHRLRIFDATRRPKAVSSAIFRSAHGLIERTGKLGQGHADLLDAICYCAERRAELDDGRIKLLVDPAKVRRIANINSGDQLKKLIKELSAAIIEIKEPVELACIGHLIDHIDTARRRDGTSITRINPLNGGQRLMWRIELGKAFCRLLYKDIWRGYNPAPISRIKHGVSQAVARHVLTHQYGPKGGWKLDTLIKAVCGVQGVQALRDRRRELRADVGALVLAGVCLHDDRIWRVDQTPGGVEQTPGGVE